MTVNWWENFFHGVALDFWRAAISDEQTLAEANFIARHLQLSSDAKVLDVPCGGGRISFELAKRGLQMTGVDMASEFIDEARAKSDGKGGSIDWQQRDMRDLPWPAKFDGAFCFGNSFGYLDDRGNADFLNAIVQTLKPVARFIIDAPATAECLLPTFQPHKSITLADISVSIESRYDGDQRRMFNDFAFMRNGQIDKRPSSQRIYTYRELLELLGQSGLDVTSTFGSLDELPFATGSQRLLLVCQKQKGVEND